MTAERLRKLLERAAARTGLYRPLARLRRYVRPPGGPDLERLCRTGELPLPTAFTFEPTLRCSLRCSMCYQNEYRDAWWGPGASRIGRRVPQ